MTAGPPAPTLRILVTGASGLIGGRLARAFAAQGHSVIVASRRPRPPQGMASLPVDFSEPPPAPWWAAQLQGVDVVVNAVGIFRERGRQNFEALHVRAPTALFEGAAQAGVRLVVQLSALGSDADAPSEYYRSKHRADEVLRRMSMPSLIVQPSLVYAPDGASSQLFRRLATLPVLVLPRTTARVQPAYLEDLVQAILQAVQAPPSGPVTLAAVGPEPMTLATYLARLRKAMGIARPAWQLGVPPGIVLLAARILGHWPGSLVDTDAMRMLLRGHHADPSPFASLLGHVPRPVESFIDTREAAGLVREAGLRNLALVARLSVAIVWIWTGIVSLGLYPVPDSLALLDDFGLRGAPALLALHAGALLDLALGILTLAAPAHWMQRVWCAQLIVIAGYTAMITLRMPQWWLHPYGPLSKNLPMMAVIGMLWMMQRRA